MMIRRRSAAFRPVVKDRPVTAKIGSELEKRVDISIDGLMAMVYM
jgi:hypothetical protein